MRRLRNQASRRKIQTAYIPSELRKSEVGIIAIGPVHDFKVQEGSNGPQPIHMSDYSTNEWAPIQRITVQNTPAARGIENIDLFIGA